MERLIINVENGETKTVSLMQSEIDSLHGAQPEPVPRYVTMRQARLALLQQGLLNQVEAAMQSAGESAQIEWEYAQGVEMDSPLVEAMRDALGLSDDDVLGLFAIAGGL